MLRYIESSAKCAPTNGQEYVREAYRHWRTWTYSPSISEYKFPRVHLGLALIVRGQETIGIKIVRTIEHLFVVCDSPNKTQMLLTSLTLGREALAIYSRLRSHLAEYGIPCMCHPPLLDVGGLNVHYKGASENE